MPRSGGLRSRHEARCRWHRARRGREGARRRRSVGRALRAVRRPRAVSRRARRPPGDARARQSMRRSGSAEDGGRARALSKVTCLPRRDAAARAARAEAAARAGGARRGRVEEGARRVIKRDYYPDVARLHAQIVSGSPRSARDPAAVRAQARARVASEQRRFGHTPLEARGARGARPTRRRGTSRARRLETTTAGRR